MKLVGDGVPRPRSAAASSTPTPRCRPSFPGMHGAGRRAGVRREGHRLRRSSSSTTGVDTGPIVAQAAVPVEDDDDVESLHERIKVAERADARRRPSAGWPATASPSPTGRSGSDNELDADERGPDPARPGLRLRQDRARGARPRPARRRRRAGLHRRLGRADRGPRRPGHQGRGAHRLPRVPRRPGQDAAPEGARRHPRRPPPRLPRRSSSPSSGVEPFDLVVSNLYPFTRDRRLRRLARTSASSRSTSAGRRWCAPRPRTTRRSRSSPRPARYADVLAAVAAGGFTLEPAPAARRRGVRAHRDVRRRASRRWMGSVLTDTSDGTGFPAWIGRDLGRRPRCCATARTRTSRPRSTRNDLGAGARAGRAAARQGDVLQQLRRRRRGPPGGVRLRRAGRRDHQARQPVRHRGRRRRRRGAPQGARLRPGLGVRRRDRGQPAGLGRDGRAGRRGLHRGDRRAGVRGRRGRGARRRKKNIRLLVCAPAGAAAASSSARSPAAC